MATRIPECFDALFFTDSTFGKPSMAGDMLTIPVTGVKPLGDHPIVGRTGAMSGTMIFAGVVSSTRTVTEYIGDPTNPEGFGEPYQVTDLDQEKNQLNLREYGFEGVSKSPLAWIDNWIVWASSFEFEVDDELHG